MTRVAFGSDAYLRLPAKEAFEIAVATLVDYEARPNRDYRIAQKLEQEVYRLRVDASLGPPGHPELADPVWDICHNTYIRSGGKGGKVILFEPSPAQRSDLLDIFESDRLNGFPGRYWLAKTRRVGGSLLISQWIRTGVSRSEGQNALVTAHNIPSAESIFRECYKLPWEQDPLRPTAKYANRRQLLFEDGDSSITVMPVKGGAGKGAGTGYQWIHWSEILRYEEPECGVDIEDLLTNHIMTMPQNVYTFACGESSGRGDAGAAYELFQEAYKDPTNGDLTRIPVNGWRMIFLASYKRWDALKTIETVAERADLLASLTPEEKHLVNELKQPLEHVKWRREFEQKEIRARSPKARKALMRQECPITFSDCFQARGLTDFDIERVRELLLSEWCEEPKWVGELRTDVALYDPRQFRHVTKTPMPRFAERDDGELLVWRKPVGDVEHLQQGLIPHRYAMGVDIAEGTDEGHYSCAYVIDRDTKEAVAAYHGKARHDELLRIVRLLSRWYNDALICNEVNRFKKWTEDLSMTDRGKHMYIRRGARESIGHDTIESWGWLTTESSKDAIVEALAHALEHVPQFLRWRLLLEEMKSFRRKQKTGPKGGHWDTIIAAGLAWYCDRDMPKRGKDPLAAVVVDPKKTVLTQQWETWLSEQRKLRQMHARPAVAGRRR